MSYANLIDANLNKAFNLLKDLAIAGTLVKSNNIDFDFATGTTQQNTSFIPVKFIIVDNTRDHKDVSMTTRSILLKTKQVGEINANDRLNVGSEVWKFSHVLQSDGYITQAEVVRES